MSEEEERKEGEGEEELKNPWYHTKRNWGFWVLMIGFVVFLITWFIVKPMLEKGG